MIQGLVHSLQELSIHRLRRIVAQVTADAAHDITPPSAQVGARLWEPAVFLANEPCTGRILLNGTRTMFGATPIQIQHRPGVACFVNLRHGHGVTGRPDDLGRETQN
jgi:hypothetical protein